MSDLVARVAQRLQAAGIAPDEAALLCDAVDGNEAEVDKLLLRRIAGEPLPYVVGRCRFFGVDLLVSPGALVPRAETELLARTVLTKLAESARVIDMCCGSGNLACAVAYARARVSVWASDLTDSCVAISKQNVAALGLGERVSVFQGDLFASFAGLGLEGTIDLVMCNPPYISTGKLAKESADLLTHEPREAFDGGPYGLSIHQRVMKDAVPFLRPRGWLLFEIGLGQEKQIQILFDRARVYEQIDLINDEAGRTRVALARIRG